jgi:hypothetical protein
MTAYNCLGTAGANEESIAKSSGADKTLRRDIVNPATLLALLGFIFRNNY